MPRTLKIDKTYRLIIATVLFSAILGILPTPPWAQMYWPDWTLLTTIYWCLAMPWKANIKFAWVAGIFVDILQGSLLGHHAMLYTLSAYLVSSFHQRIRLYPSHQQIIPVLLILLLCASITMWINGLRYSFDTVHWQSLAPAVTGALMWPWIFAILRRLRQTLYPAPQG